MVRAALDADRADQCPLENGDAASTDGAGGVRDSTVELWGTSVAQSRNWTGSTPPWANTSKKKPPS